MLICVVRSGRSKTVDFSGIKYQKMSTNTKPRICYILPSYDLATGSHFFHLYQLLERAREDLDIFLVIEKTKAWPGNAPFRFYCQKFSFPPLRFAELLFILMRERMGGRRYFYTHYSFFGALASWFVTTLFGGVSYYWNCGTPWLYRRSFFEEAIFRFVMRHNILVTGTAGIASEYSRRFRLNRKRIIILSNWIKILRFDNTCDRNEIRKRLGIGISKKIILFVHHLSRRKGVHLIVPVAKSVTERFKNVIFVIIGAGPELERLRLEVENQGLGWFVRLIGEIPNREIEDYFAAADIFFMPSEEEGFPHVLLEALAAGVPYIASNVGGVKEITPPVLQKYIVGSGDVDGFAAKIVALLTKPASDVHRTSEEEREWVKRYDLNEVLPKFVALFS